MKLADFKVFTFDCYGTLIDWESGIGTALQPLLARVQGVSRDAALECFARHESAQQAETPRMLYTELLAVVHRRIAREWGVTVSEDEHRRFATSLPNWPAFPDSTAALQELKRRYLLVILSNVDRAGFAASNRRLNVVFDAVFTAEDIGSYKPDLGNFRYLLDRLAEQGLARDQILHTAQSLFHDHVPAKQIGLATAWIDRRGAARGSGATPAPAASARYDLRFESLAAMAHAVREELAGNRFTAG
ncbi:MAG: haloacid dehalogenase type II [Alphaproteobacteria bacterium]|nr:haloacid dehalogenase type II [Alphaproteobacteria bacterium]